MAYTDKNSPVAKASRTRCSARYNASAKGKSAVARYQATSKGKAAARRANTSPKGRASGARYRAQKLQATPAWANAAAIADVYATARDLTELTYREWHVDHIVPLKHPRVCGLHVEYNLRAIEGVENQRKGNWHWPDMPA